MQEVASVSEALARLADESFDVAVLDVPRARRGPGAIRWPPRASCAPSRDRDPDHRQRPVRSGKAFAREVAAVLPRPLPEVDALLRAYVKRLAGFRRSRTRGQLVLNAFGGIRDELAEGARAGARRWTRSWRSRAAPSILVLGDARAGGGGRGPSGTRRTPDAVVVGARGRRAGRAPRRGAGARRRVAPWSSSTTRRRPSVWRRALRRRPRLPAALVAGLAGPRRRRGGGPAAGRGAGRAHRRGAGAPRILTGHRANAARLRRSSDVDVRLIADAADARTRIAVVPTGHEVLVVDDEAVVLTVLARGAAARRLPRHDRGLGRGGHRSDAQAPVRSGADGQEPAGRVGARRAARGAQADARARDRPHHRLQLVRLGRRGAGHRRARLHRKADPRRRRPALPDPARAVAPRRAARAPQADPDRTAALAGCCWSRSRASAASSSPSTWASATT